MDCCIRIVVVTTALLTYTVTARSYHGYHNHHRFDKQHQGYESNDHGHWPNHQSWEAPHDHHPRDFGHYLTEDYSHYPSKDFGNSPESRQSSGQSQEDLTGDSEEFWGNGSDEDSNNKSWEDVNFPQLNGDTVTPMPWWLSPQVNNMQPSRAGPASTTSTTSSPMAIRLCLRTCPVTAEYNPVCGSNNVTYNNPGRLECAQNCGVDVTLQRRSTCALPIPADTSVAPIPNPTVPPITNPTTSPRQPINEVKPTRLTTIEVNPGSTVGPVSNGVTIPQSVLDSIFTTPGREDDDIEETDMRHEKSNNNLIKLRNIMTHSVSAI